MDNESDDINEDRNRNKSTSILSIDWIGSDWCDSGWVPWISPVSESNINPSGRVWEERYHLWTVLMNEGIPVDTNRSVRKRNEMNRKEERRTIIGSRSPFENNQ